MHIQNNSIIHTNSILISTQECIMCLLGQSHPCPIWLPVLPLNATYILLFSSYCFQWTWHSKFHVHFLLLLLLQRMFLSLRPCVTCCFLLWRIVSTPPNPKLHDHPLQAACDCLLNIFVAVVMERHSGHLQPEGTSCHLSQDPFNMAKILTPSHYKRVEILHSGENLVCGLLYYNAM